ncbi:SCO6745 family protein [Aquihabitans sp. McL0605]|uniref:SCO6745 family protein n=1 Tax=Aquihabitans sp. McL0605 TaxID=3415671 RepID=UPI003CF3275E
MEPLVVRKMWGSLEAYHGMIYFAPSAIEAYAALGITGRSGYFASRSAPMGAVPAEVVIATFFNFDPALVTRAMAGVWATTTPAALVQARLDAADATLRSVLGPDVLAGADMAEAAALARQAATDLPLHGRPLFAGHASLPWPDEHHLVLWHAISLLREFRGDGHLAALTMAGLDGCEALVTHAAAGDVPASILQSSRGWSDADWAAAGQRLADRGLVDAGTGAFTDEGRALRAEIEATTDRLAAAPWQALGAEGCERLRALAKPFSKAVMASGVFG